MDQTVYSNVYYIFVYIHVYVHFDIVKRLVFVHVYANVDSLIMYINHPFEDNATHACVKRETASLCVRWVYLFFVVH